MLVLLFPCLRCADTIDRAIESIFHQTLRPSEVILVDDCSKDETLNKLFEIQSKYPEEWIKIIPLEINGGPGTARNTGWNAAKHKYVVFLDSDDPWDQRKIEFQYGWMSSHPEAALTGHKCNFIENIPRHKTTEGKVDFSWLVKINYYYQIISQLKPLCSKEKFLFDFNQTKGIVKIIYWLVKFVLWDIMFLE